MEYALRFAPIEMASKQRVRSELHQNILDVFNEFGVQITSPNYVADPAEAKVVSKNDWAPPPAGKGES